MALARLSCLIVAMLLAPASPASMPPPSSSPSPLPHGNPLLTFRLCQPGEHGYWAVGGPARGAYLVLATVPHHARPEDVICVVEASAVIQVLSQDRPVLPTAAAGGTPPCLVQGWVYADGTETDLRLDSADGCEVKVVWRDGTAALVRLDRTPPEIVEFPLPARGGWQRWHYRWGASRLSIAGRTRSSRAVSCARRVCAEKETGCVSKRARPLGQPGAQRVNETRAGERADSPPPLRGRAQERRAPSLKGFCGPPPPRPPADGGRLSHI